MKVPRVELTKTQYEPDVKSAEGGHDYLLLQARHAIYQTVDTSLRS